jgi:hypothetical protein
MRWYVPRKRQNQPTPKEKNIKQNNSKKVMAIILFLFALPFLAGRFGQTDLSKIFIANRPLIAKGLSRFEAIKPLELLCQSFPINNGRA